MRPVVTLLFSVFAATAQTAPPPRFEVASVKPGGDTFSTKPQRAGGRIRWTTELCYLVGYAYRLDFSRVSYAHCGVTYSLEATFDPASSEDQVRQMIQSLLTERFQMRAHRITTQTDGYGLVLAKDRLKVSESKAEDEAPAIWATTPDAGVIAITARRVSIAQLAELLHRNLDTPVWDRTGISGAYSFSFRFTQSPDSVANPDAPSLATALRDALGLKLEKQKGPVETLIIDAIREPVE
jgi:uncharacterized protein (TIGR03435 family)